MEIGIITIHKIHNYGSALQAYALQQFMKKNGYDNKIIDYHWTWENYNPNSLQRLYLYLKKKVKLLLAPNTSWARFTIFQHIYFDLTKNEYTKHNIVSKAPNFDLYITGSDQVWNCRFTDGDANFLLQFAPITAKRISYASSFATAQLKEKYKNIFQKELSKYTSITVREKSGVNIVKELTGKDAKVVCDPTLLLTSDDYSGIALKSKILLEGKYILVYILDYMYDPYPHINKIIEAVVNVYKEYKIVYLNCSDKCKRLSGYVNVNNAGPLEFLSLIQKAQFVVTTSFHGTAFAAIFRIPLLSVVQDKLYNDGRIHTLLSELRQLDSLVDYKDVPLQKLVTSSTIRTSEESLSKIRNNSRRILLDMLCNAKDR